MAAEVSGEDASEGRLESTIDIKIGTLPVDRELVRQRACRF